MDNIILEKLDELLKSLNEAEATDAELAKQTAEKIVKSIPVNPEMETADQGRAKAWEKLSKYFYNLTMQSGGMGAPMMVNDEPDLPDDWLDPDFKGKMSGTLKDPEFERNKVIWDPDEEMERLKKDVELDLNGSDDDFDDFDYRDNTFGDDADMDDVDTDDLDPSGGSGSGGDDDDRSEDEKLRDSIDDALDKLSDNGLDDEDGQNGGQQGNQQQGNQQGGQQGNQQGNQQGGQQGGSQDGQQNGGQQSGKDDEGTGGKSGRGGALTKKDQKLKELKDALDKGNLDKVEQNIDKLKEGEDGKGSLAGENIGNVSDKNIQSDMSKAGISQKDINEMSKMSKQNPMDHISEDEMDTLKKQVVDGLEKQCQARGGSALAQTIVKHALKSKINNDEWQKLLKLFLKSKSVMKGEMSKSKSGTKYGHKNHLWRDAVLPTKTESRGQIQTIYCFVDFSGSVDQDLVYIFLGRVINLCAELNYTNVKIYGVGSRITLPREINGRILKKVGLDVALSQTWDFIQNQKPGQGTTNFTDMAEEIMRIRHKEKDAVYLVFGDAEWGNDPLQLKDICGPQLLDRICMLIYYRDDDKHGFFRSTVAIMKEIMKMKNVITTKVSTLMKGMKG